MIKILDYIVPIFVTIVLIVAIKEKKDIYSLFIDGVKESINIVFKIIPFIFAIIFVVNFFEKANCIKYFSTLLKPITNFLKIPVEVLPLLLFSSLSGSAAFGMLIDIFEKVGPDSLAGKIASLVCGGSETTFYILTVFFSLTKVKKTKTILFCALAIDAMVIILSIIFANTF